MDTYSLAPEEQLAQTGVDSPWNHQQNNILHTNISTIKHLISAHESTNEKAREDTRRKPTTRVSWIQKQVPNDRPHPRRKPTEGEVKRI